MIYINKLIYLFNKFKREKIKFKKIKYVIKKELSVKKYKQFFLKPKFINLYFKKEVKKIKKTF